MRIGLVCPYDWDSPGGVQVHVRDLALELMRMGHEVEVLAPAEEDVPHPTWFTSGGPSRAVAYNGSVARLAFGLGPTKRVREWIRANNFDVLHVHEPLAPSLSALAVWAATGPIVGTFHASMERSRMLAAGNALAHTVLEKVRGRIAVSEFARRTFEALGGGSPGWLVEPKLGMISAIFVGVWVHLGFYTIILLAGLQGIDNSVFEAATMDGATRWQITRRITLPLLKPTTLIIVILSTIHGFQSFDFIYTLTGGGPLGATTLIVQYIYERAFQSPIQYGLGSAAGVILFLIIFAFTALNFLVGKRREAI